MSEHESDGNRAAPLVVVSNRLPVTVQRARGVPKIARSAGGLVAALEPALRRNGGTWIGWSGARALDSEALAVSDLGYHIEQVALSETEIRRYYHGFSNRTLWPLFHSMPDRAQMLRAEWQTYEAVNERFAEVAAQHAHEAFLIWVHDYQLMRTPRALRARIPHARIGFFLHIPFPPYDLFRILPWYRELLRGLLACDLVGVHCPGYATNLIDCAERLIGARVDRSRNLIAYGDHTTQVGVFPIGIDVKAQSGRATAAPRREEPEPYRTVLGVDRLDYTKGIPERIEAFERLLELHPEHRERVVLLQLAVPSRGQVAEYQALKRRIDELVGRVNGRFATPTWTPIHYLYRSMPPDNLAALYRDADVALVTPLRDGMNLVAKEYVASQVDDPGVLILSRMAGAAETMHEALQVNPYNLDSVADRLHRALCMDRGERSARIKALQQREQNNDVYRWLDDFLESARQAQSSFGPPAEIDFEAWLGAFLRYRRLALFLDYDGTLTPIVEHPDDAKLSPEMRDVLTRCARRDDCDVTIVSGRGLKEIAGLIDIPGVTYVGNHGFEICGPGLDDYLHPDVPHYKARAIDLAQALREICPEGAWVEEKGPSLTLHFREIPAIEREPLAARARPIVRAHGFQARDAHCAVESRPPVGWDKGHAVLHTLRRRYGPSWSTQVRTIYAGDDKTDEDAFRALAGLGITFWVGGTDAPTQATRTLPNVEAVKSLLEWLARRPVAPA